MAEKRDYYEVLGVAKNAEAALLTIKWLASYSVIIK